MDNIVSYKSYDNTCKTISAGTLNVIENVRVNNAFSHWTNVHFEGDKIPFYSVIL